MQNVNIHDDFEEKDIRDFLGRQYQRTSMQALSGSVEWIENEIARLQKQLKSVREHLAVKELLKMQGWEAFDISDEVPYNPDTYFNFVGTEQEYEALIEKCQKPTPYGCVG